MSNVYYLCIVVVVVLLTVVLYRNFKIYSDKNANYIRLLRHEKNKMEEKYDKLANKMSNLDFTDGIGSDGVDSDVDENEFMYEFSDDGSVIQEVASFLPGARLISRNAGDIHDRIQAHEVNLHGDQVIEVPCNLQNAPTTDEVYEVHYNSNDSAPLDQVNRENGHSDHVGNPPHIQQRINRDNSIGTKCRDPILELNFTNVPDTLFDRATCTVSENDPHTNVKAANTYDNMAGVDKCGDIDSNDSHFYKPDDDNERAGNNYDSDGNDDISGKPMSADGILEDNDSDNLESDSEALNEDDDSDLEYDEGEHMDILPSKLLHCPKILIKGKRRGMACGMNTWKNGYCKRHMPTIYNISANKDNNNPYANEYPQAELNN